MRSSILPVNSYVAFFAELVALMLLWKSLLLMPVFSSYYDYIYVVICFSVLP